MNDRGISLTTDIRVLYADTDAMKIVYHGNYLTYFEAARTNLFRSMGLVYTDIERAGYYLVVLEARAEYKRPAVYDDIIHVTASLKELPSLKLTIDYVITRNNETELLVTGTTVHAFVNASTNRPIRPPKEYFEIMKRHF